MLKSIQISNYAIISELTIDFNSGFSVITGETGAGKSIIMGALSLILGQRADTKQIKEGCDKCIIEAEFEIKSYNHLLHFFEANDLDFDSQTCIIRREITSTGKSRSFVNDSPVGLNILKELSGKLIDIHSQHENLLLSTDNFQLQVLDSVAANQNLLGEYQLLYKQWKDIDSALKNLIQLSQKKSSDLDYLQFQYNSLVDAKLTDGELEELESELETLTHAEDIKTELTKSWQLLDNDQMTLALLKEITHSVNKVSTYLSRATEWHERLNSTYVELKDLASEMLTVADKVEYNPGRTQWVEGRLSDIYALFKKFKVNTVAELIGLRENFGTQLHQIESFDEDILQLQNELKKTTEILSNSASILTESRAKACTTVEKYLIEHLSSLGMPNIQFKVSLQKRDEFSINGCDEVEFLFSANKNRILLPVTQIASGGEISRLMLSIKSLIANRADLPTIIFDEIDTGVSGDIAHRMAEIMHGLSTKMQVITITHLPQIASKGDSHFKVYKDDRGEQTLTNIVKLDSEERIREIAQMLSGKDISDAALENARELLK